MSSDSLWVNYAACKGSDQKQWFLTGVNAMLACRAICAECPARKGCGEAAFKEEETQLRFGFRAYMTPAQRETIARQGGLRGRDPMDVVEGINRQHRKKLLAPPLDDDGGPKWTRVHETLARRLRRWLPENVAPNDWLPDTGVILQDMNTVPDRLQLVLDALVRDGTLTCAAAGSYIQNGSTEESS